MTTIHNSSGGAWNASLYDDKHSFVFEFGKDLLTLLAPRKGERILDLGCGTGHLTHDIAVAGAEVIGIDNSPDMIEQAQRKYPDVPFQLADARTFQFADPFDAVFSNAALHWVKQADQVVTCVSRALKPDGRFVAEFGGKGNVRLMIEATYRALERAGIPGSPGMNPWYFPSIGEYASLLETHGLYVMSASLFDRLTALEDGDNGIRNWMDMFASHFFQGLSHEQRSAILEDVEDQLRPHSFRNGTWYADYKRLRIVAVRGKEFMGQ